MINAPTIKHVWVKFPDKSEAKRPQNDQRTQTHEHEQLLKTYYAIFPCQPPLGQYTVKLLSREPLVENQDPLLKGPPCKRNVL